MKKIIMLAAAAAMTAMTFTSCNKGGSAKLNDDVDSLTYYGGVWQSEGLKQAIASGQIEIDSAYIDEFIKGMKEGALDEGNKKKEAYMNGIMLGKNIKDMAKGLGHEVFQDDTTRTINVNVLLAGFIDGLKNKANMSSEEAMASFQKMIEPVKVKNMEKQYGEWKKQNEKYLADNKKKAGVTTLPSGVQYKIIKKGDGAIPSDTSTIKVNYVGKDINEKEFDSSYKHNQPMTIPMAQAQQGGLIEGWVEVLKMMPAGSTWEVTIPADKAYGIKNMGDIKPFSTLIFTIEVLK